MEKQNQTEALPLWDGINYLIDRSVSHIREAGAQSFTEGNMDEAQRHKDNWEELVRLQASLAKLQEIGNEVLTSDERATLAQMFHHGQPKAVVKMSDKASEPGLGLGVPLPAKSADQFDMACQALFDQGESLLEMSHWDTKSLILVKEVTCLVRSLMELGGEWGDDISELRIETLDLKDRFELETDGLPFYGFSLRRIQTPKTWAEIACAYRFLAVASDTLDWLESEPNIDEDIERDLIIAVSATETFLYRLFGEYVMKVGDDHQRQFNARVRELVDGRFYVPWWNMDPHQKVGTAEIYHAAENLEKLFEEAKVLSKTGVR